ncbi:HoxN/HupN/NixA family nickel/cobalt transporter [Bradyrhizobium sp. 24]|uniref:HoxN/HupN/NixA family nickel/cobalt transporter n=1 Tax=unclassified Bradyrhizobium TaxID=2631580 RepID=UPI001FFAAA62|nr:MULTISPECIES: HoxN/HupN/NixA family nickel/cobalt transporter [unclassified Bradyrhizobium]MCK1296820.1 HoxN/HupN/NixA family nickel/cobalt transporter [Bradyrhizobium sp. 37]MCK1380176.1 HoxN/HupN/NixA family nickel/cobalt transporter [Bradyrhizobium sp. 24]MCK1769056.1 HoxN/HupN/NixA family nickel/cobalt transporter [Bradyrhizobium sp. 134]
MANSQHVPQKASILATFSLLIAANVALWIWTLQALKGRPELLGTALLAYVFGLRHAFDPDHIAAIDNVVRKLMQDQRPSMLVGFYFALGHSSIVMLASIAISGTAVSLDISALGDFNLIRTLVSAFFLLAIGLANYFILKSIWATFIRVNRGENVASEQFDPLMAAQGPLNRLFRPLFNIVTRSWHMFPVGFMFGLGFDTATEIGLFGISATQAAQGTSFWTILLFPLLFAAGMTLMDTADSVLMTSAYGWAFVKPIRKLWYNLTLTTVSVIVAIFIGGLEVLGLVSDKLGLDDGAWSIVRSLNAHTDNLGYVVVAIFILSWICSALLYHFGRFDDLHANQAAP